MRDNHSRDWILGILFVIAVIYVILTRLDDEKSCSRGNDTACIAIEDADLKAGEHHF